MPVLLTLFLLLGCAPAAGRLPALVPSAPRATAAAYVGPRSLTSDVRRAYRYGRDHGVTAAVAVLDTRTGRLYGAGAVRARFGSASVMKLFVATKLLATGRMHGHTATLAYSMITRSDDQALEALLPQVDYTRVIDWVAHRYGLHDLGAPSPKIDCWGNTQITAEGIVRFYARMRRDRVVAPWLLHALNHHARIAKDGTDQSFGIPSTAAGRSAVKQGWGHCSSNTGGSVVHTTGLIDHGRYAIAILSDTRRWSVNGNAFNAHQARVVTRMARLLLPAGQVDAP